LGKIPKNKIEKQNYQSKLITQVSQGLIIAILLHTVFNYLIIISKATIIYSILVLIITGFFIFWDFEKIKVKNNVD